MPVAISKRTPSARLHRLFSEASVRDRGNIIRRLLPEADDGMLTAIELLGTKNAQVVLVWALEVAMQQAEEGKTRLLEKVLEKMVMDKTRVEGTVDHIYREAKGILGGMTEDGVKKLVGDHVKAVTRGFLPVAAAEEGNYEEIS